MSKKEVAEKAEAKDKAEVEKTETELKKCFVIMPISDMDGYDPGHFTRVYDHIIKPACYAAGFKPKRADEEQGSNHIIIDILKEIVESDMAICDLSGRNPNVLYELGIRQSFNLPVVLLKDDKTSRIFDIQTMRDIQYDARLRIDKIEQVVPLLTASLKRTYEFSTDNQNRIVQLLGIEPAKVTKTEISDDTNIILNAISDLGKRVGNIEARSNSRYNTEQEISSGFSFRPASGTRKSLKITFPSSVGQGVVDEFVRALDARLLINSEKSYNIKENSRIQVIFEFDPPGVSIAFLRENVRLVEKAMGFAADEISTR